MTTLPLKVSFKEIDHSYSNVKGEVYTSATQLISKYKQPYDKEYWSLYKAIEEFLNTNNQKQTWWDFKKIAVNAKDRNAAQLQERLQVILPTYVPYVTALKRIILGRWDEERDKSCEKGTAYHLLREHQSYTQGFEPHSTYTLLTPLATTVQVSYSFDLKELADGYYSELLVYNHPLKISGQIDKVWITTDSETGIRYVDIDDYKTNKVIKTENKYQKMQYPLNKLDDTNAEHYKIQISLYGWMLEQQGYVVRSTQFTWIKDSYNEFTGQTDYEEVPYPFTYYRTEVEQMLAHYQKQ